MRSKKLQRITILLSAGLLLAAVLLVQQIVLAQDDGEVETAVTTVPQPQYHPEFTLLDENGENVLESGAPISTMTTCGQCHDSAFIEQHSFHADLGLSELTTAGETGNGRAWDTSTGVFGKWNGITYRYLSPAGDDYYDLTVPEWIEWYGSRHVGGGPAMYSRSGEPLTEIPYAPGDIETNIVDPDTGELIPWDWQESGVVEMNCFLCHTPQPNNQARIDTLRAGDFRWANTATLLGTGIVEEVDGALVWNPEAFNENGELAKPFVTIQDPTSENCAQCHGLVHVDSLTPLVLEGCTPDQWSTITTGQIFSPQRMSDSGMNLPDKETLGRSWDVHAERVLECTNCHYSLNNPTYYQELSADRPEHLIFDPRRIDLGEYLNRPLHEFAKGSSAQGTLASELDNTARRCESCHSVDVTHDWLPYKDTHMEALSCESCHVPQMFSSSRQFIDWTIIQSDGTPRSVCRGVEQEGETFSTAYITGYQPVLLPLDNGDGTTSLAPHNLITAWFWVYGDPERPVPLRDLQAVWLDGDQYHADILQLFDANGDGTLDEAELVIDSDAKEALIASRLEARGLESPRIQGEVQPYSIHHDVATGEWATQECTACHGDDSRVTAALQLSNYTPGGVTPTFVGGSVAANSGELVAGEDGALYFQPITSEQSLYVLGHDSLSWVDWLGALLFVGTLAGVFVHGGLRYWAMRRNPPHEPRLRRVYMYGVYERLWHWLQTAAIMLLIFTGLVIHKPSMFGIFSFKGVVLVHNVLAAILVVNAALSLFYHLVSGEIRQFLPRPRGFFDQAIEQTLFYLRGIFKGDEHPFDKTRDRKLNPLQQMTYFGILNVLLPLQVITGLLMWGVQRWPEAAAKLGGLPGLAPFHTLIAWLFAQFIVLHVYLTTTGHTPMAGIKAMMLGWDDVEVHDDGHDADEGQLAGAAGD
ncbi:MAG: cytochrome b/b6 domain-containing protein [Ardenticatenaceae bacterium]|nr:cytochrome b/b6 domain-containing protein [Anaerolineales bacterium]MCB8923391.1 cytochrome b/b6 domain-containing protein [Ardenticatenaceae bacterium]